MLSNKGKCDFAESLSASKDLLTFCKNIKKKGTNRSSYSLVQGRRNVALLKAFMLSLTLQKEGDQHLGYIIINIALSLFSLPFLQREVSSKEQKTTKIGCVPNPHGCQEFFPSLKESTFRIQVAWSPKSHGCQNFLCTKAPKSRKLEVSPTFLPDLKLFPDLRCFTEYQGRP